MLKSIQVFFVVSILTAGILSAKAQTNGGYGAAPAAKAKSGFFTPNPIPQAIAPPAAAPVAAAPVAAAPVAAAPVAAAPVAAAAQIQSKAVSTIAPQMAASAMQTAITGKKPENTPKMGQTKSTETFGVQGTFSPRDPKQKDSNYSDEFSGDSNPNLKRMMALIKDQQPEYEQKVLERKAKEKTQQEKMERALADAQARGLTD